METLQAQLMVALLNHLGNSYLRFQVATDPSETEYYFHLNFDQILALEFISGDGDGVYVVTIRRLAKVEDIGTEALMAVEQHEFSLLSGNEVRAFIYHVAGLLEASGEIWLRAKVLVAETAAAPESVVVAAPVVEPKAKTGKPVPAEVPSPAPEEDFDDIPF